MSVYHSGRYGPDIDCRFSSFVERRCPGCSRYAGCPGQEPPPPPAAFVSTISPDQLAFLKDYEGKSTKELRKDKRFHKLMDQITPRTEYHYGWDMPLTEAVDQTLDGPPLPVEVRDGRYVMVGANTGSFKGGKGFAWFDMQAGIGIGGVYFHPTNGEPTPTLAIYSRQIKARDLGISQFPAAFARGSGAVVAGDRYAASDGAVLHPRQREEVCAAA